MVADKSLTTQSHAGWIRPLAAAGLSLGLAACGGGGGDSADEKPMLLSGPLEFNRCAVPEQISIVREDEGAAGWKTNRYLKFAGSALTKLVAGPGMATTKNPEGVISHGPLHAQNCTPGTGSRQTLSFRVRTQGFFGTGAGNHLAFGTRANYPTFNALGNEQYEGIGAILHPGLGGVLPERFGAPFGGDVGAPTDPQVEVKDNTSYLVEMSADRNEVSYRVTAEGTGQTTGWKQYQQPLTSGDLLSSGLLFAVLCKDSNARCEAFDIAFRIDITDIAAGWS